MSLSDLLQADPISGSEQRWMRCGQPFFFAFLIEFVMKQKIVSPAFEKM